jgi:ABC-type transport system substrate-binding protein
VHKGELLKTAGRQVGVKINVVIPESWNAFMALRMGKEGKGQLYDMGWSGGGSDPVGRYELYKSDGAYSSFSNAEYDALVPKLAGLRQPGTHEYREALDILPKVIEILETEMPVFVIAYTRTLAIGRADLMRPSLPAGLDAPRKYWGFTQPD